MNGTSANSVATDRSYGSMRDSGLLDLLERHLAQADAATHHAADQIGRCFAVSMPKIVAVILWSNVCIRRGLNLASMDTMRPHLGSSGKEA